MSVDVIEGALAGLCANYLFPETAAAAATAIRARRDAGEYSDLDEETLARRLTADLFEVCGDKHLTIKIRPEELRTQSTWAEIEATMLQSEPLDNYGIAKVERLEGNIGYIDIRYFTYASVSGRAVAAAMELVSRTGALILDLRRNTGGEPDGVAFWSSYLFPDGKTHLNDLHFVTTGKTRQYWTLSHLPGERYLDRPVHVLTSGKTFSAGEEFCYNLKALGRATLIGQTTRGGAHVVKFVLLTSTLAMTVPFAKAINPVTGTNWEGTGVEPDLKVPSEEAFTVAYQKALQYCLTTSTSPAILAEIRKALT
jgi:C-terminal processing protease CtpA/Prc